MKILSKPAEAVPIGICDTSEFPEYFMSKVVQKVKKNDFLRSINLTLLGYYHPGAPPHSGVCFVNFDI